MTFASVADLQTHWVQSLERFAQLRAQYLFYTGLKEHLEGLATQSNPHLRSVLTQTEHDFMADVSHVEIEKDAYYKQMIANLRAETDAEESRGLEVRQLVQNALLETIGLDQTQKGLASGGDSRHDFSKLETRFSELELQLNEYADASSRIDRLAETSQRLEQRYQQVQRQTREMRKAFEESSRFLATLQNSNKESVVSAEEAQLTKLIKFLV